ncbi:hypothetical protein [Pseudalkalibacillus caeni]|uniref:Uncharacterized protein n=1 Tax=Exobacillus caeni TaxID=2574798 RepID=A0A5R9F9M5_9BACL|nr:hypothetical protein [Pseudalkalibacillus caeni]TLS37254.1 hypothetical protein FCL54_12070 [Pseudalkalibacillus caeni]
MDYKMPVKELDNGTDYPLIVLSGMTGLSQEKIKQLSDQGHFQIREKNGEQVVNGKDFLAFARSVNNHVDVEKTNYSVMKVNETE